MNDAVTCRLNRGSRVATDLVLFNVSCSKVVFRDMVSLHACRLHRRRSTVRSNYQFIDAETIISTLTGTESLSDAPSRNVRNDMPLI